MSTQFDTKSVFNNKRLRKDLRDGLADQKGVIAKKIAGALALTEKEAKKLKSMLADRDGDLTAKLAMGIKAEVVGQPEVLPVPGVNEIQTITFSATPASGDYKLQLGAETTAVIAWNATTAAIKAALEALTTISLVAVSGNSTTGIAVEFQGIQAETNVAPMSIVDNTVQSAVPAAVTITVVQTQAGVPAVAGQPAIPAVAGTELTAKEEALLRVALADQPKILSDKIIAGEDFSA